MSGSTGRVSICFVEWGPRNRGTSLGEVVRCVALSGLTPNEIVIVDNKGECAACETKLGVTVRVIAGSNRQREFSGWDEAYDALVHKGSTDVFVFANDTLASHRRPRIVRRRRFASWMRHAALASRPEICGQEDPFVPAGTLSPFGPIDSYLSTYMFIANRAAAPLVFPLAQIEGWVDGLLKPAFDQGSIFVDDVPAGYRAMMESWLHDKGNWHLAAPLDGSNFAFFRLKAKSILYEHALPFLMRQKNVAIHDIFDGRGHADRIAGRYARWWLKVTKVSNIRAFLRV